MGLRGVWGVAWEGWWPALAGWVVGPGDISRGCAKMGLHPTTPIVFNGARSSLLGELVLASIGWGSATGTLYFAQGWGNVLIGIAGIGWGSV